MIRPYFFYTSLVLTGIIGFSIGGSISSRSAHHNTLKLCSEKPLECKFKYDIIMYQETGKIPYSQPVVPAQKEKK